MPWRVERTDRCPVDRPFGVFKEGDGELEGCHMSREMAERQMRALYANESGGRIAAMADLHDVEIARPGTYDLKFGKLEMTEQMLEDAVDYSQRPDARPAPVKLGHSDPRFEGEPALGWLSNLRMDDEDGPVLKGSILGMPDWLGRVVSTAYPDRSLEGWQGFTAEDGREYGFIIDGLALLGVAPPGMSTIRSLRDLPQALGVAATARIVATRSKTPDSHPGSGSTAKEGAGMDPAKIREALGLAADASEEEVRKAFVAATASASDPQPPPTPPTPPQPSELQPEPQEPAGEPPPPKEPELVAAGKKPGVMMIEAAAWDAREERLRRLEAEAVKRRRDERDQIIANAVQAGKFPPSRTEHWVRLWEADPEGTRTVIDGLAPNVVPIYAMGFTGGADDDSVDEEWAHLFPPVQKGA